MKFKSISMSTEKIQAKKIQKKSKLSLRLFERWQNWFLEYSLMIIVPKYLELYTNQCFQRCRGERLVLCVAISANEIERKGKLCEFNNNLQTLVYGRLLPRDLRDNVSRS